jgi:hypothetical protein
MGTHVLRPFPSWFVTGAADGHSADLDNLEPAFVKDANFVGFFKTFKYESDHDAVPFYGKYGAAGETALSISVCTSRCASVVSS